jgi:hypothetical protein
MVREWGEEILAYFTYGVTQGPVEGNNHRAKVIQRQAYGYHNFTNHRLRLLVASCHTLPGAAASPESAEDPKFKLFRRNDADLARPDLSSDGTSHPQ